MHSLDIIILTIIATQLYEFWNHKLYSPNRLPVFVLVKDTVTPWSQIKFVKKWMGPLKLDFDSQQIFL